MLAVLVGDHFDAVVGRAALAAEHQGEEGLVRLAGLGAFLRHLKMALGLRLDRGPHRVAPGEKLVQAKGEDRKTARGTAPQLRPLQQELAQHRRALRGVGRGQARQLFGRAVLDPAVAAGPV